ncbi:SurA N-terminal domain-containing protein [Aquisalimonas lutea]|uniref:SurA N-terminal domain-containing protein n=1 Tax=Aquisalimonas lutea TaxID=1327750 RepID=UPI0025B410C4|nr:SurA N-terminal domain-containing protein [Aquisalimonas lutea]MDN3519331.1 SurA N-terminal domain-containing protein [Aquisalimonas lutea]
MLQQIRDRASGWIAWVVIILIAAAFALFGLSNYMSPGGANRAVATVNGQEIGRDQVSRVYRNQRQQIEQMYGDDLEITERIDQELRREALRQLINQRLLSEYLEERNMTVSDEDLAAIIRSQDMFQEDGRFSRQRYEQLLQANQMSTAQYEEQVRRRAVADQLRSAVADTGLVTDRELNELQRLQAQERNVAWFRVRAEAWRDEVSVDDEAVTAYYEDNPSAFTVPERVRLAYVELARDDMLEAVDVSASELRERYEQVRDQRYTEQGRVEARHILISVEPDASEEQVQQARERAREIRQRLRDGESFAELAEEYSDDIGSASQGGDLGRVRRGDMVEPFEDALFSLDEGEISEPVRTDFGFHIIQATTMERSEPTPLEEVRDELRREIARERVSTEYVEAVNRLDQLAYDMPDSLQGAAEALDLEVQTSDWMTRQGTDEGIGSHPEVVEAAFDPEVLEERMNSPAIEITDQRAVVVRVAEHEPQQRRPLEEVRDDIEERLRTRRAREQARAYAEELQTRLDEGAAPEALLEGSAQRLAFEDAGWIGRSAGDAPGAVRERAFRMPRPGEDGPETAVVAGSGDPLVLMLRDVRDGDPEELDAERRQQLADRLRQAHGDEALTRFIQQLRADADVEILDEEYR